MNIDTGYGTLHVRTFGGTSGTPIVLLHPLATSGQIWQPFADRLGRDGRPVLAPDFPAATPDGTHPGLTMADLAAGAAAAIEAHGAGPADVLGMSMGGCVALQLVLDRPDLVRRLVLADTTATYGPDRVAIWAERARTAETSVRTDLLDFQLPRWFTDDFRRDEPDECARVTDIFVATAPAAHAACCRALGGFDASGRLGEITAPSLVLVGDQDFATPAAMSQALADGLPNARMEVLPGAGHFSLLSARDSWDLVERHFGH